ncbi:hypothetical protein CEK68_19570 [Xanthomonas sp. LMG 12461]|nr:hypothetical protein CEK68_19570 [Xanthomonas sp. LMG 12461]
MEGLSSQFLKTAYLPSVLPTSEIGKDVLPPSTEILTSMSWFSNVLSSSINCATDLPLVVQSGLIICECQVSEQ